MWRVEEILQHTGQGVRFAPALQDRDVKDLTQRRHVRLDRAEI